MNTSGLIQGLSTGGAVGVLAFIVIALIRGWLVPGFIYRQVVRQRDDMTDAVLQSTTAAQLALEISKRRHDDDERDRDRGR